MLNLRFSTYDDNFQKVAFKLLLKNMLGFSLKEAKVAVDAFVNGQPFSIEMNNEKDMIKLKNEAQKLGANGIVVKLETNKNSNHLVIA